MCVICDCVHARSVSIGGTSIHMHTPTPHTCMHAPTPIHPKRCTPTHLPQNPNPHPQLHPHPLTNPHPHTSSHIHIHTHILPQRQRQTHTPTLTHTHTPRTNTHTHTPRVPPWVPVQQQGHPVVLAAVLASNCKYTHTRITQIVSASSCKQ